MFMVIDEMEFITYIISLTGYAPRGLHLFCLDGEGCWTRTCHRSDRLRCRMCHSVARRRAWLELSRLVSLPGFSFWCSYYRGQYRVIQFLYPTEQHTLSWV